MTGPIYLDCAASTPPDPRVIELMVRHLEIDYANPGSRTHDFGARARRSVEKARDQVAQLVGARRSEVIFTSSATEAANLAVLGLAQHARHHELSHIVTTQIEHPAVLEPVIELERQGFSVTRVKPCAGGWVDADEVLAAVKPETFLVSVMHVNNETGVEQPISEIAAGLKLSGAAFHVDAAQSFGKLIEPLRHPRIDFISVSAHKIMGPQGVGALIARRDKAERLHPLQFGGGQERGLRPGTLPGHLIAGFGLAAELARTEAEIRSTAARAFRETLLQGLAATSFEVNGDMARTSPYLVSLSFPGLDSEQVIDAWSNIAAVSNGSACASSQIHCSHVLSAMGISENRAAGAVRISWCPSTPMPDCAAMVQAVESLREVIHGRSA